MHFCRVMAKATVDALCQFCGGINDNTKGDAVENCLQLS